MTDVNGWVIKAGRIRSIAQQREFLVALSKRKDAAAAVQEFVGPDFKAIAHARIDSFHLSRRDMRPGQIMELGKKHVEPMQARPALDE